MELSPSMEEPTPLSIRSGHSFRALRRATAIEAPSSSWSVEHVEGTIMRLEGLIEVIQQHSSLKRVQIVETRGYKQRRNGILHRFLVLELFQQDNRSVWLRLDRRMHPDTNRVAFLLASGKSPAHDTVRGIFLNVFSLQTWGRAHDNLLG